MTGGHEFENDLLDFDILAALSRKMSAADIEQIARERASELTTWMACKETRWELHGATVAQFPADPPPDELTVDAAVAHLVESRFWKDRSNIVRKWDAKRVRQRIEELHNVYESSLASDWKMRFSGKELFRSLRSRVDNLDALATGSTAQRDEDLGKRIARAMRTSGKIGTVFDRLRSTLRKRANLSP